MASEMCAYSHLIGVTNSIRYNLMVVDVVVSETVFVLDFIYIYLKGGKNFSEYFLYQLISDHAFFFFLLSGCFDCRFLYCRTACK